MSHHTFADSRLFLLRRRRQSVARSLTLPASALCCPDLLLCRPATPTPVITPSASTPLGVDSYLCTPTQCRVCIMVLINPVRGLCDLWSLPCSFSHVLVHIQICDPRSDASRATYTPKLSLYAPATSAIRHLTNNTRT
jgi:hypothetical protein